MIELLQMPDFLNPDYLVRTGGFLILLVIIFAETGLFFGFFLPGDSLLFTAGLLASIGILTTPLILLLVGLTIAGILGNFVGYSFGRAMGIRLFSKEDSFIFKKKYILITEDFFERYGKAALIVGRFLPIIRTFAPIMAGVIKMNFKKFSGYNIIGSFLWVFSLTLAGYFFGEAFPAIKDYLEYVIIVLVIIPVLPAAITYFNHRKKRKIKKEIDSKILLEKEEKLVEKFK